MCWSMILKMLNFHLFKALGPTFSCLHQRLPKSFNAAEISPRHFLKSMRDGNLYLEPLQVGSETYG